MKSSNFNKGIAMLFCLLFVSVGYSQDIGGIVKRKIKKRSKDNIEKTVDKGLDIIEGKDGTTTTKEKRKDGSIVVVTTDSNGNNVPVPDFINPKTAVFIDDFNNEKALEFPSRWSLLSGTLQNNQVIVSGKKEGVAQFITRSRFKPTFKNDNYLGDSFKVEIQCFFHKKGNESYTLNLMNKNDVYGAYDITIRGDGIVPAGSSSQYARFPHELPVGWRTVQLSFNQGVLKVFYEGYQLINIPRLQKTSDKMLTEFTHLEVSALSSSATDYKAMINHIAIAHQGLPLYKKLMNEGKLVMNNIRFEVNSFTLTEDSFGVLDEIANMLTNHSDVSLSIQGHTDSDGTQKFNQQLSENRAGAVKDYLVKKGISSARLNTSGFGESKPLDTSSTEVAKAKNRRVEFILQ